MNLVIALVIGAVILGGLALQTIVMVVEALARKRDAANSAVTARR